MPEENFARIFGKIHEYGEETRMQNLFERKKNGDVVPLTNGPKKPEIQFRNSSDIKLERKPCGCMANKVKPPESS